MKPDKVLGDARHEWRSRTLMRREQYKEDIHSGGHVLVRVGNSKTTHVLVLEDLGFLLSCGCQGCSGSFCDGVERLNFIHKMREYPFDKMFKSSGPRISSTALSGNLCDGEDC